MAKSDILTTVAARIAAATSSTPVDELATLKVLGAKLGLDTTNVVIQASTASNTASSKDLYDVVLLNQAIDDYSGNCTANITLPFAVEQGDVIYANEYGSVFNNNFHNVQVAAHQRGQYTQGNSVFGENYTNYMSIDACKYTSTINSDAYFTLLADNGDLIVLSLHAANYYALSGYALSEDMKKAGNYASIINGGLNDDIGSINEIGVFITTVHKTAANTWRIYYAYNTGSAYGKIYYKTFTYNPSTKILSGIASVGTLSISTNSSSRSWAYATRSLDGLYTVYTYYTGTTNTFFVVNNNTGVGTEITNVATTTNGSAVYLVTDTNNTYHIVVSNTTEVKIATVPGNVAVTVPAAAIPVLKYTYVKSIGSGEFICSNGIGKQIRLLKFGVGFTTVIEHTLGTDNTSTGNTVVFSTYLKMDKKYYLYNGNTNTYSFTWDGTNTPVERKPDGKVLYKQVEDFHGQIDPNAIVLTGSCGNYMTSQFFTKIFKLTQSVLWSTRCSPLFRANAAAAANTNVSVTLFNNVVPDTNKSILPNAYGFSKLDAMWDNIKFDMHASIASTGAGSLSRSYTNNLVNLSNNIGMLTKPGKYEITTGSQYTVYTLYQCMHATYSGSPTPVSTVITTNVPMFIQGMAAIVYLGEI